MKLPSQQKPSPIDNLDATTKTFVESLNAKTASGDYLVASLTTTQTDIADNAAVAFETVLEQRGTLTLATGTVGNLKAGRTYLIHSTLKVTHTATLYAHYSIHDVTSDVQLTEWELRSPSLADNNAMGSSGVYLFTPEVDTEIEIRNLSGDTALHDVVGGAQSRVIVCEIGATVVSGSGGLEFMDVITVGADTTSVQFGQGGDGQYQRPLDGDVDEEYVLSYYFAETTGGPNITLRPNGISTNQVSGRGHNGTSTGNFAYSDLRMFTSASGRMLAGTLEFQAKTGRPRSYIAQDVLATLPDTTSNIYVDNYAGIWDETATNITTLQIVSSIASELRAGTRIVLWRRKTGPARASTADTNERRFESAVAEGTATTEQTAGHTLYAGSVIGLAVRIEEAVTAGTVTCNLKIDGVTTLSAVLDTTNATSNLVRVDQGVHPFAADKNVSLEIVTSGYTNAASETSGLTAVVTMMNEAFILPPTTILDTTNTYTKAQVVTPYALAYGSNISVDAAQSNVFTVTLTGATAQLDNPTNMQDGHTLVFRVTQDGTGGRALTFDTLYDFGEEGAPDLTTESAGALSIISCMSNGTKLYCTALKGFVA